MSQHNSLENVILLVVDDEPSILCSLNHILKQFNKNIIIETAMSAEEALEIAEHTKVDFLIVDYRLPTMSGLELIKTFKAAGINCQSIIMSAYSNCEIDQEAKSLGCKSILRKPFEIQQLLESLPIG